MKTPKMFHEKCAEPTCNERGHFQYDNAQERDRIYKDHQRNPWRCNRHTSMDTILSLENPTRESVYVLSRSGKAPGLYWTGPHEPVSGFISGPGFKAFRNDFEEGTRITVTVKLEPPQPS